AMKPNEFWPWFWRGLCAARRQKWPEAREAFTVCLALNPDQAAVYSNRGRTFAALGDSERALADFDRALQLDPNLLPAALIAGALNRGVLHYQARRMPEALAEFQRALEIGADPGAVH